MTAKKIGRKPRAGKTAAAASFIEALKFISVAQKKNGQPYQTHCVITNHYITAFDGVLTAGHPIEEDVNACPHTFNLLEALKKCGENLAITQLDTGKLSIKSDKFKALIYCEQFEKMPYSGPDEKQILVDDKLKKGFEVLSQMIDENAVKTTFAALLLRSNTMVATNGKVLVEHWHGINFKYPLLIPKVAIRAVFATEKQLVSFGFSDNSATFYFEDDSYIKTQIFNDIYPDIEGVLANDLPYFPLPDNFYEALRAVEGFSESRIVYFDDEEIRSSAFKNEGASFEIEGLPANIGFNADYLFMIEHAFLNISFDMKARKCLFYGNEMRGAIMGCALK